MEFFKKLDLNIYEDLLLEINKMISSGIISWNNNQICINTVEDKSDNYWLGTGSLILDWEKYKASENNGIVKIEIPPKSVVLKEKDFCVVCDQFKNTVFEDIINMLKSRYTIGRVRLMKLDPKSCLSWHVDSGFRLHFPIKTQSGCFMIINDEVMHLPEKTWWWTDTTKNHTALNASKESRIHLVVSVVE
jgi:hypothetical protein